MNPSETVSTSYHLQEVTKLEAKIKRLRAERAELLAELKVAAEHIINRKAQEATWRTIAKAEGKL